MAAKRSHLYVMVTDMQKVLVLDGPKGLALPNYSHWPAMKPRPRNSWAWALLKHVTYGLFDLERNGRPGTCLRIVGQHQLPPQVSLVRIVLEAGHLDQLVKQCKRVRLWMKHYGGYPEAPWKLRLVDRTPDAPVMDPVSMQCWTPGLTGPTSHDETMSADH